MTTSIGHRKRCRRFNEPGDAHFLTFSCFRRQSFLSRDRTCQWLADAIRRALAQHQFHLWAYVFMPEHVHLLVWPTQRNYQISKFLATTKLPVAARAVEFVRKIQPEFLAQMLDRQPNGRQAHRFWQRGGGYDRNLTRPKEIWEKIDYIHNNPVTRGLCQRSEDWYWSSAGYFLDQRPGPLQITMESVPERIEFVRRHGLIEFG